MLGAVRRVARSPYLANCLRYGTFFCGAELVQQLALRKYGPWSQVDNNVYIIVRYTQEIRALVTGR